MAAPAKTGSASQSQSSNTTGRRRFTDLIGASGDWGPVENFIFVVVEKEPPHAVAIYECDDQMLETGRRQYREALQRFKECQEKDQWPGFDQPDHFTEPAEVGTMTETNTITIQQDAQPAPVAQHDPLAIAGGMPLVMHRAGWSRLTFKTMSRIVSSSSSSLSSWESPAYSITERIYDRRPAGLHREVCGRLS